MSNFSVRFSTKFSIKIWPKFLARSRRPLFGRTDLRKGVSEAKFDVEADFDVKKSLAPQKSAENHEKPKKIAKLFPEISASKNRKLQIVRNAFSRSFAAIGAKFEGRTENLGIYFFRNVYGLTVNRNSY